jgi:hypothetical protein
MWIADTSTNTVFELPDDCTDGLFLPYIKASSEEDAYLLLMTYNKEDTEQRVLEIPNPLPSDITKYSGLWNTKLVVPKYKPLYYKDVIRTR